MNDQPWQPIETAPEPSDDAEGRRIRYLISGTWLGHPIVRETEGYRKSTVWENIKPTHWRPMHDSKVEAEAIAAALDRQRMDA